jgi:hypothetical protein
LYALLAITCWRTAKQFAKQWLVLPGYCWLQNGNAYQPLCDKQAVSFVPTFTVIYPGAREGSGKT